MISKEVAIPCGIALVTYVFVSLWARRRRLPKPPGPSFMEIDPKALAVHPWKVFHEWALKHGPLISWTMFGKTTVVIDSAKIVEDLLEARSAIYSDRPLFIMASVLAERKHVVPLTSSQDPRFKIYRRLMNGGMSSNAIRAYRSIQVEELHKFLKALESSPERFSHEVRRNACAVIMKVAYGYELTGSDDEFVKIVDEGFNMFVKLVEPGWLVEFFPWLRFVPAWFPGARFKRLAHEAMVKLWLVDHKPFQWALDQISSGDYIESFVSQQLEEPTPYIPDDEKKDCIKWVAGSLYGGGVDTTGSALTTLFYVMQMYPDVQKRAQKEIDTLTGGQRLLTFDDYESLPYVRAVLKEILRWGTVAPLGLVHSVTQDDVYEGYLIPKNCTILANIWAILHDPELYPEPFTFNPGRHLGEKAQTDPLKYVFGFGRRVCPGSHLAQASLFLNAANVLAVFDISKEVGTDGKEIEPPQVWTTSLASSLEAFPCKIKVRSPELLATVQ